MITKKEIEEIRQLVKAYTLIPDFEKALFFEKIILKKQRE